MKKKLFLKFFVLAVIGAFVTFTSCKDYDDDISKLNSDLSALKVEVANKSDLSTLKTELEGKISGLQSEIATLKADLAKAATKEELDAAKAELLSKVVTLETFNNFKAWVDGEIATLKADLAKASTKEEVEALKTLLNSEIASVREELSLTVANLEALTEIVEGNSDAIADVETQLAEQLAEIEANATEIEALKADLEQQVEDLTAEIDALKALIETMQGDLNTISVALEEAEARLDLIDTEIETINTRIDELETAMGADLLSVNLKVNSMITEVSFDFVYDDYERYRWLKYSTTTEVVDFVFSDGINKPITFKKGQRLASQPKKILVKVSPANADLSKMTDKISLIRGDNNTKINDYLTVVKAERANPLLTRATPTVNGLWYVSFELSQTADLKDLAKLTSGKGVYLEEGVEFDNDGHYLYAMAIENTVDVAEDAEARFIISDFVISIDASEDFKRAKVLDFMVDETKVSDINNRAADGSKSLSQKGITYEELVWTGDAQPAQTTTNVTEGDDRSAEDVYPAVQGTPMKIKLTGDVESIRAMYVTLDYKANAIESAPSEWNAWQSYSYTGLGTVVEGTETEIVINNNSAINDMIGFRVFAVNFDGTLVDPDGKAFYVSLGEEAADWKAINTVIIPESEATAGVESNKVAVSLTKVAGATAEWNIEEGDAAFHAIFRDAKGDIIGNTNNPGTLATIDFSEVATVSTEGGLPWTKYEDDKVNKGTLTIRNATKHVVATINVTMTKKLPTTVPTGFSVKTNQVVDGIYNAYLIPGKDTDVPFWNAPDATLGTMPMEDVFNYGTGAAENYLITFATSKKGAEDKDVDNAVAGDATLSVAKSYIDNTTKHATSVEYNYGLISSKVVKVGNIDTPVPHKVQATAFETVYNNIYNSTYTWAWDTKAVTKVEYGAGDNELGSKPAFSVDLAQVLGKSSRDGKYNAPLSAPYLASLTYTKAELISKANGQSGEYFDVDGTLAGGLKFTKASGSTNPTADVPSTLRITLKNMYNQDVVVNLDMTVTKR